MPSRYGATRTETRANQGKYAENKVRQLLDKLNAEYVFFDFERIYDARSGVKLPRVADYQFYLPAQHGVIEVKKVEHAYRLPVKNFQPGQLARMNKRRLAGGHVFTLVLFQTTGKWRCPGLDYLMAGMEAPSWDMRELPEYDSVKAALEANGFFELFNK